MERCFVLGDSAQRYALESLSRTLGYSGDDRLSVAYMEMLRGGGGRGNVAGSDVYAELRRSFDRYRARREELRRTLFSRFPDLKNEKANLTANLQREAAQWLASQADQTEWKEFLALDDKVYGLEKQSESAEESGARQIRFVRLGKSIILAHQLRQGGDTALIARFEKLIEAEGRSLLPNSEQSRRASL